MKTKHALSFLFAGCSIGILACKKEHSSSTLAIHLTDAPAAYDEVNIDLREVRVNFSDDSSGWTTMDTKPGIYNLLGLQHGVDSLIAKGLYPTGNMVKEVRLVVGNNNTIKANGQIYPLTIPSGAESGLKIKISKMLQSTLDSLVIDFDADLSVQQESDGYKLRPVIRVK